MSDIEKQRFDAVSELSQIEMKISDARVAFEKMKEEEASYIKSREDVVVKKLNDLSEDLSGAFKSFSENKETFEKFKGILSEFSIKVVNLTSELKEGSKMFSEALEKVDKVIEGKVAKISDDAKKMKEEREDLQKELENLNKSFETLAKREYEFNTIKVQFLARWNKELE